MNKRSAVAIVPAYNESGRIERILPILVEAKQKGILSGIIVVNDGSKDDTAEKVLGFKEYEVQLISFKENKGKDKALFEGFKTALRQKPDFLVTIDADIIGLTPEKIEMMIKTAEGNDMVIGRLKKSASRNRFLRWIRIHTAGQRVFQAKTVYTLMQQPEFKSFLKAKHNLGIDLAMSIIFQRLGMKTKIVDLPGVDHVPKREKASTFRAFLSNKQMNIQWAKSFLHAYRLTKKTNFRKAMRH